MKRARKFVACLLAYILMYGQAFAPVAALAATTSQVESVGIVAASDALQDAEDSPDVPDGALSSEIEPQTNPDDRASGQHDDEVQLVESTVFEDEVATETAEVVQPLAADISHVEFVYIDYGMVKIGETQNVAIGFTNLEDDVVSARLAIVSSNGEISTYEAANAVDQSALFTIPYATADTADSYTLQSVSYSLSSSDQQYEVRFDDDANDANDYTYEVVTPDLADTLAESGSEDGVSAITIDEDGELHAADSIEDALNSADAGGVAESHETATAPSVNAARGRAAVSTTREDYLVVAIDPGHGGGDVGAVGNGLQEKNVNWGIAQAFKTELDTYTGVTAYLTRAENENPSLQERAGRAKTVGADVFVSVHCNSGADVRGAEVWAPNSSSFNSDAHQVGSDLGSRILSKLTQLGLTNRGVKFRDYGYSDDGSNLYPDGSMADYYGVIRNSRKYGIPAIIVEHAFISNAADAAVLASNQTQLGIADATGVAEQYNLGKDEAARAQASVAVTSHVSNIGWEDTVYDHKVSGTTGKNLNVEAITLSLLNGPAVMGGIEYKANIEGSWTDWVADGEQLGATGRNTPLQAVQIQLTGSAANSYDVYYRAHVTEIGWLGWAKNGESAGSSGYGYGLQAIEVVLVNKGSSAPGSTDDVFRDKANEPTAITYRAHVRDIGWQNWTSGLAGTTGRGLPVEALQVRIENPKVSGGVRVQAHVMNIGWMDPVEDSQTAGTTGRALQVEAVRIELTGELKEQYDIYYRTHVSNFGWLGWAKNGEDAGSQGFAYGIEALEIKLVPNDDSAPGSTDDAFRTKYITYQAHVSEIGWQSSVNDGAEAGTTGRNLPMEALKVSLGPGATDGDVMVRAHVRNIGWQDWVNGGVQAGTTGRALPIEALQIKLTGKAADTYDVYYRLHVTDYGWLGWAKNGASAGTQGYAKSAQAVQIVLVAKGSDAPGSESNAFLQNDDQPIMGSTRVTAQQMVAQFKKYASYPSDVYASKGASTIEQFVQTIVEEASVEGVRADVVFAQAMHETNWLRFGGDVSPDQCNFAGIGATGNGAHGNSFKDVRTGIRAQVQHLKAYASTDGLVNPVVDPRFNYVQRGCATTVKALGGRWAVGAGYGDAIISYLNEALEL